MVTQSQYVAWLGRVALHASQQSSTVFVGRGMQYLLPRHLGLAVRIVAPLAKRIERAAEVRQLDVKAAKKYVREHDLGRAAFIKNYFHRDVNDALEYDLVLNRAWLSFEDIVETIVAQCRRRFAYWPLLAAGVAPSR